MGRYVRQFEVTIEHDGESITAVLRPATYEEVMSLDTTKGEIDMGKIMRPMLDRAIMELRLKDAAGSDVPKSEFLSVAYFGPAVMAMGTEWLKRASPQNPPSPGV